MSKSADKLAKLAGFGMMAGAEPAAAAREAIRVTDEANAASATTLEAAVPTPAPPVEISQGPVPDDAPASVLEIPIVPAPAIIQTMVAEAIETDPTPPVTPPKPATVVRVGEGSGAKVRPAPVLVPADPVRDNLTRNVVFLPEDQTELDRIEDLLRIGGIRKPTIADLVRVALRAANPQPEEAAQIYRDTKALDARRAENKNKLRLR
jgi:hypothetical protein